MFASSCKRSISSINGNHNHDEGKEEAGNRTKSGCPELEARNLSSELNDAREYFRSVSTSRIVPAQMSSITKLRLLIIEMRRSDVFFFSFSSAQNIGNINSVCVIMPPPSPGRMISCCSRDNSRASTDNPGCSDVFVFSFSSAQNFENINSVCVIMPPSFPGRMISCSRDNSPASTDDPGYLGSSRIRKFPE